MYICIWNIYLHPKNNTPRTIEAQWGVWEENWVYLSRERSGAKPSIYPPEIAMTWKLESQRWEPGGQWQVLNSSVERMRNVKPKKTVETRLAPRTGEEKARRPFTASWLRIGCVLCVWHLLPRILPNSSLRPVWSPLTSSEGKGRGNRLVGSSGSKKAAEGRAWREGPLVAAQAGSLPGRLAPVPWARWPSRVTELSPLSGSRGGDLVPGLLFPFHGLCAKQHAVGPAAASPPEEGVWGPTCRAVKREPFLTPTPAIPPACGPVTTGRKPCSWWLLGSLRGSSMRNCEVTHPPCLLVPGAWRGALCLWVIISRWWCAHIIPGFVGKGHKYKWLVPFLA